MSESGRPSTQRPVEGSLGELAAAREHLERGSHLLDEGAGRDFPATVGGAMKAQAQLRAALQEFAAWAWVVQRSIEGRSAE